MPMDNRVVVLKDGQEVVAYEPQPYQQPFHESNTLNLLALGTRNTGKSTELRWDAIIRCMMFPGFRALILRRKIPDLKKSHINFLMAECQLLGCQPINTPPYEMRFPNGSKIVFTHCENMKDVMDFLSSEWDYIGFDELSTFTLDMFLTISAACRSQPTKPYEALVRCCSNPLGIGAAWMKSWFIDKDVNLADYPDYNPDDYEMQFQSYEQNKYFDPKYLKKLNNLPEHIRKAWKDGEFVVEGAYFTDFQPRKRLGDIDRPWHVIPGLPRMLDQTINQWVDILDVTWLNIYRCVDWGYHPDPAVCLWIAVLPNGHEIVFKERSWKKTIAADVAQAIKHESKGMRIIETFCDPTMFIKTGTIKYSIGEIFESNGVPLTAAQNDRALAGYAVHDHLNTLITEGDGSQHPKLQVVQPLGRYGCPDLIRTFPMLEMDSLDPSKIADGPDHWVIALSYYCMGQAAPSRAPRSSPVPRWMRKPVPRRH